MNEIIINGVTLPYDEVISLLANFSLIIASMTALTLFVAEKAFFLLGEIITDLPDYIARRIKRKKRKSALNPFPEYTVEKADGLGAIYKNNAELVLVCNSYQNALCIKEILEDDDMYDMPVAGKEEEHE